jgi:hypothetical protein
MALSCSRSGRVRNGSMSSDSALAQGTFAVLQPEQDQPPGQSNQPEAGQAVEQYRG